jgi:hypothetical protein
VKRVKDGWVVHVTERGEIVHAILNLSLCVCVCVERVECEKCVCCDYGASKLLRTLGFLMRRPALDTSTTCTLE